MSQQCDTGRCAGAYRVLIPSVLRWRYGAWCRALSGVVAGLEQPVEMFEKGEQLLLPCQSVASPLQFVSCLASSSPAPVPLTSHSASSLWPASQWACSVGLLHLQVHQVLCLVFK